MRSTTRQLSQASLLLLSSVTLALSLYVAPITIDLDKRGNFESGRNAAFDSYLVVVNGPNTHHPHPIDPGHLDDGEDLIKRQGSGRNDGFRKGTFNGKKHGRDEQEQDDESSPLDQILVERQGTGSGRGNGFRPIAPGTHGKRDESVDEFVKRQGPGNNRNGGFASGRHGGHGKRDLGGGRNGGPKATHHGGHPKRQEDDDTNNDEDDLEQDENDSDDSYLIKRFGNDGRNNGFSFKSNGNKGSHHHHRRADIESANDNGGRDNGFAKITSGRKSGGKVHGKRDDENQDGDDEIEVETTLEKRFGNDGGRNGGFTSKDGHHHPPSSSRHPQDVEEVRFPAFRQIRKDEPPVHKGHP